MKLGAAAMVTMCAVCSAWACGSTSNEGLYEGNGRAPVSSGGASPGSGGGGTTGVGGTTGSGGIAGSGGDTAGVGGGFGGFTSGGGSFATGGAPEAGGAPSAEAGSPLCPFGSFAGKMTGAYTSSGGLSKMEVGGSFTMAITADGSVTGNYTGPSSAKATLGGSVDCATGALSVAISNGTYQFGLVPVKFEGTLTGTYDRVQGRFVDGTWVMTEPDSPQDGGSGRWTQSD